MDLIKTSKTMRHIKSIEETPQWLITNLHLKEGYRVGYNCVKSNLMSLFDRHNDLLNIWTHLIGALFFLCFLVYVIVNSKYSTNLYNELKRDIYEMSINGKIQESYKMNIVPTIVNLKSYGDHISMVRLSKLKDQISFKLRIAEQDYIEVLNDLTEKIKQCELDLLKKFEIECDRTVKNLSILKTKFIEKLTSLKDISVKTFKHTADRIEKHMSTDHFFRKLRTALQLELEIYPIVIFILCAVFCLGASAIYHTFYVMSPKVNKLLHRFDMAGINILIFGSVYAMLFYFFYCSPHFKIMYAVVSFASCLVVFIVTMGNKIHMIENIKLKGLMFGVLGISNAVPLIHALIMSFHSEYNNDNIPFNRVFLGLLFMGILYLTGLIFYVFRIPERYYPKVFDIWFNSHTIWHLFVFAATCAHLYSVITLYQVRKNIPCSTWL